MLPLHIKYIVIYNLTQKNDIKEAEGEKKREGGGKGEVKKGEGNKREEEE